MSAGHWAQPEQRDYLFLGVCEVVSTKRPNSGTPVVGLVMAQRIHVLETREAVEAYVGKLREAADAAWPLGLDDPAGVAVDWCCKPIMAKKRAGKDGWTEYPACSRKAGHAGECQE